MEYLLKVNLTEEVMKEGIKIGAIVGYDRFEEGEGEEYGFEWFEDEFCWINIAMLNTHYGFENESRYY